MTNIAQLLKDAPEGMKLYSPLFGEVEFCAVDTADSTIVVRTEHGDKEWFSMTGKYKINKSHFLYSDSECLLFPSKECRTWEGWKLPVQPKFKVGDKIQEKHTKMYVYTVLSVDLQNQRYLVEHNYKHQLLFTSQDNFELAPKPHYDISNFKPFDKVLTRDSDNGRWSCRWFSRYDKNQFLSFITTNSVYSQCIPFNDDTKHLLGTTDMPNEYYINW